MNEHIRTLDAFDVNTIPDLDVAVMGALELFQQTPVPKLALDTYKHPLVVGSGNAEAAGRIIFQESDALFASESTYEEKLRGIKSIDGVVLISASGGKHAPGIAQTAKRADKPVTLITNTPSSPAGKEIDTAGKDVEYVFPKNREPYTYNTSTYMGMILGATGENPALVAQFIAKHGANLTRADLGSYDKFFLIVPPRFSGIIRMLQVKFIELFGRRLARDVETAEYMAHAVTVVPSKELFIRFGDANDTWGVPEHRWNVPLPEGAGYAAMMAVGYYVIAQIQKQHHPYFKENIVSYTKQASAIFGQTILPIVENA